MNHQVRELLAAVLHLGDIRVEGEGTIMSSEDAFQDGIESGPSLLFAADLLKVPCDDLGSAISSRQLQVDREIVRVRRTPQQAHVAVEAMCKRVYALLFRWLVVKINDRIEPRTYHVEKRPSSVSPSISLLDLFGFEALATNSFEQLCINYANESLQAQFNADVFFATEREYQMEGVTLDKSHCNDNSACLALFEGMNPPGIFPLLNEECSLAEGSDNNFALKLGQLFGSHAHFRLVSPMRWKRELPRRLWPSDRLHQQGLRSADKDYGRAPPAEQTQFAGPGIVLPSMGHRVDVPAPSPLVVVPQLVVRHYACEVVYDVRGFREKNADLEETTHANLLRLSKHPLLSKMIALDDNTGGGKRAATTTEDSVSPETTGGSAGGAQGRTHTAMGRRRAATTIGARFMKQLSQLRRLLAESDCHYIRCVKPNTAAAVSVWDPEYVCRQLAQAGVFEAARAARRGFHHRLPHRLFVERYSCLMQSASSLVDGASAAAGLEVDVVEADAQRAEALRACCGAMCAKLLSPSSEGLTKEPPPQLCAVGRTKVFLRAVAVKTLEQRRRARHAHACTRLQAAARGRAMRNWRAATHAVALTLQRLARGCATRRRFALMYAQVQAQAAVLIAKGERDCGDWRPALATGVTSFDGPGARAERGYSRGALRSTGSPCNGRLAEAARILDQSHGILKQLTRQPARGPDHPQRACAQRLASSVHSAGRLEGATACSSNCSSAGEATATTAASCRAYLLFAKAVADKPAARAAAALVLEEAAATIQDEGVAQQVLPHQRYRRGGKPMLRLVSIAAASGYATPAAPSYQHLVK